jgi:hypothetical protein
VTPVVLLVLAVLWIAVLTPGILRKRAERRGTGSIDSFHRSLHLLERTGPKLTPIAEASGGPVPTVSSMPGRPNLVLLPKPVDGAAAAAVAPESVDYADPRAEAAPVEGAGQGGVASSVIRQAEFVAYERRLALKRRQQIALGLGATFVLTALLGFVPSLRMLWVVTLLSALAIAGYIGLMVYARQLKADQRTRQVRASRARSLAPGERVAWYREDRAPSTGGWAAPSFAEEDTGFYDPQPAFAYR